MDENKLFDVYFELPDGYEAQLMVLRDFPGGQPKRGLKMSIFRSRVWVGLSTESDPLLYKSEEHADLQVAIDGCYSVLLAGARQVVNSPDALEAIQQRVHAYFSGVSRVG